jgi:peroxiredoxin (alkyl hydroperoxide reductase subunit C)
MKKYVFMLVMMAISLPIAMAQEKAESVIPLLGAKAPSFTAQSTDDILNFPADIKENWKILFCHPADFTPVCSSELLELAAIQDEFKKLQTAIVVVSTDSKENHINWVKSLESLEYNNIKQVDIKFPLVEDKDHSIARKYGMIHPATNSTKDVRGVFILDPEDKIAAMFFYPMEIGRNIDEIKRTVIALQTARKGKVLTPANWKPGGDVFVPYATYSAENAEQAKKADPNLKMVSWYMMLKKAE